MSAVQVPEENPLFEEVIVVTQMTQRQVNTQYGEKPVFDVIDQADKKFGTFNEPLASKTFNWAFLNGQPTNTPLRVRYRQKPSKDPSKWPPTNSLESVELAESGAPAPAQTPVQATGGVQQFAPAPVQAQLAPQAPTATPIPQPAPTPIPQGQSGPSAEDKIHMRRSAAVKAAAYRAGADPDVDFWQLTHEIMAYIESGADPVPFAEQHTVDPHTYDSE